MEVASQVCLTLFLKKIHSDCDAPEVKSSALNAWPPQLLQSECEQEGVRSLCAVHCAPGSLALCPCKVCQQRGVRAEEERSPGLGMQQEKPGDKAGKRQLVTGELEVAGHTGRARLRVLGGCENLDLRGHMELSHEISSSNWAHEGKL